ncbi:MAG TPA: hypothetical protein VIT91_17905 [Chthoniobacterales bacterium]
MDRNDDKELWDLLGQARQPRVRGSFADNVLREIRRSEADLKEKNEDRSGFSRFWKRLTAPLAVGAAAVIIVGFYSSLQQPGPIGGGSISNGTPAAFNDAAGQIAAADFDGLENIDDYLHEDDNSVWLGNGSF